MLGTSNLCCDPARTVLAFVNSFFSTRKDEAYMDAIRSTIERHKAALLARSGCTAVAMGKKIVKGVATEIDCVVIFVKRKENVAPSDMLPSEIDGIAVDVVEREFLFVQTSTNPFDRFDPAISGISITAREDPEVYGTIGCFIRVIGHNGAVPPGNYILTNEHVLQVAAPDSGAVIQPGNNANPQDNWAIGNYVYGLRDRTHDCAVATIVNRGFTNQIPNHPWHLGNRRLTGIAAAALGDRVYKYGATTKHTVGVVQNIAFNVPGFENAILIQGENNQLWCNGGDSGSVVVRYADDHVLALNFIADTNTPVTGGFSGGLAYDIQSQMAVFGQYVDLAPDSDGTA